MTNTDDTHVVVLSDDEDCVIHSIEYKTTIEPSSNYSSLYEETRTESQLLANFIEKCLVLENSKFMFNTLKNMLREIYYKVEKSVRDSPKIQKALIRANNLLLNDPHHKYSHIKDLCEILKSSQVKKKVPFTTLSTDLKTADNHNGVDGQNPSNYEVQIIDINCGINGLKRTHTDPTIAHSPKKLKPNTEPLQAASNGLNCFNDTIELLDNSATEGNCSQESCISEDSLLIPKEDAPIQIDDPISKANEGLNCFNDTIELLDNSATEGNCSQESCISEDSLLIPKEDAPIQVDDPISKANEEKIKKLERKIAFYKKEIARLDELEVDDDSVNSPYIRSERLKSSLVNLYKQLCELTGHTTVKEKEIRLQVIDGHPPGPTKTLETFLNKNIDSSGNLPFPDFCDVVNCVRESNEKDDLGWTGAQIMKEAYILFTHCGRALQKRRQKREYRDLLHRVKLEACDKDPADDDPELLARLQENKRISEKKESEILDRYTKMQFLPTKTKSQKQQGNSSDTNKTDMPNDVLNHNNNDNFKNDMAESNVKIESLENSSPLQSSGNANESMVKPTNTENHGNINQKVLAGYYDQHGNNKEGKDCDKSNIHNSDAEMQCNTMHQAETKCDSSSNNEVSESTVATKLHKETPIQSTTNNKIVVHVKVNQESSKNLSESKSKVDQQLSLNRETENSDNINSKKINIESEIVCSNSIGNSVKTNMCENSNSKTEGVIIESTEQEEFIAREIKQEPEEELMIMLQSLGENFSVTVETITEPFLIIEVSDSSDEE